MVYNYKNINEEAEVEEAEPETKQAAIDLLKELLERLEAEELAPDDEEETEEIEVDSETCKESAQILVKAMGAVMESTASVEAKLDATNILNKSLKKIMEEAGVEETDGGLPCEVAENEEEEETCVETGERKPTDIDMDANYGEGELKESAANALLRELLNK